MMGQRRRRTIETDAKTWVLSVIIILSWVGGLLLGRILRDWQLGITWMLIIGSSVTLGIIILTGYLKRQAGRREGNRPKETSGWRQFAAGIMIIIIILAGIFYLMYVGILGSIFGPPPLAPEEYQTGYYQIHLRDGHNGTYLSANNMMWIDGFNYTIYETDLATNITYYCNRGSYLFINVSGYYPLTVSLWASGGTDPNEYLNNTIDLYKIADPADVSFDLVAWRTGCCSEAGAWNYEDTLPTDDGVYTFCISISIAYPSRNTTEFGTPSWIPPTVLSSNTIAYQYNWTWVACWLGFECDNVTSYDCYPEGGQWTLNSIYVIPDAYNCTLIPYVWYGLSIYVVGDFTNLQSIILFDGIIDNYVNPVGIITT